MTCLHARLRTAAAVIAVMQQVSISEHWTLGETLVRLQAAQLAGDMGPIVAPKARKAAPPQRQ